MLSEIIAQGITILVDWIASSRVFERAEAWKTGLRQQVKIRAAEFLHSSGLYRQPSIEKTFCQVWPSIPPDGVRPLQQKTEELFVKTKEKISVALNVQNTRYVSWCLPL